MTQKDYYAYAKSRMRCVRCHNQDDFTKSGRSYCSVCAKKKRESEAKRKMERKRPLDSSKNYPRGANGICYWCNTRPVAEGKKICQQCHEKWETSIKNGKKQFHR